jgi:hypothetical protein
MSPCLLCKGYPQLASIVNAMGVTERYFTVAARTRTGERLFADWFRFVVLLLMFGNSNFVVIGRHKRLCLFLEEFPLHSRQFVFRPTSKFFLTVASTNVAVSRLSHLNLVLNFHRSELGHSAIAPSSPQFVFLRLSTA